MIPAISNNSFASFGMSGGGKCTMRQASHLQQLFLGKIYRDPLHALIRELWLNAIDSMIQAGRADVPIEVSLPNEFSPSFSVRDYGVGMTHDEFESIYSDLGGSTKRQDANVTGSLGLGSKSPLGYADLFNVSCYDGDTVRHYLISKDADNDMIWVPISSDPSDEPRGVEVTVPIKSGDVRKVITHYGSILSALNHPNMPPVAVPRVLGLTQSVPEPTDWSEHPMITANVSIESSTSRIRDCSFYMGNIQYRIDLAAVLSNAPPEYAETVAMIEATHRETNMCIFAPMDAAAGRCPVDFDAGRYNIQATARTSAWVREQVTEACNKYWQHHVNALKAANGTLDRWIRLVNCREKYAADISSQLLIRAGMSLDVQLLLPLEKSPLNLLLELGGSQLGTCWRPQTHGQDGQDMRVICGRMRNERIRNYGLNRAVAQDFVSLARLLRDKHRSVLIVDDPANWRQRYEADYGTRTATFLITFERLVDGKLNRKPSADEVDVLRKHLESHGVTVRQTSQLTVIVKTKTARLKRRENQFTLQQCYDVSPGLWATPASAFSPLQAYDTLAGSWFLMLRINGHAVQTSANSGWKKLTSTWSEGVVAAVNADMSGKVTDKLGKLIACRVSEVKSAAMPDRCKDFFDYEQEQYHWYLPLLECTAIERELRSAMASADIMSIFSDVLPFGVGRPKVEAAVDWMTAMLYIFGVKLRSKIAQFEKVCIAFRYSQYADQREAWQKQYEPVCKNIVEKFIRQYPLSPMLETSAGKSKLEVLRTYPEMAHRLDRKDHLTVRDLPQIPVLPESEALHSLAGSLPHFVLQTTARYAGFRKRDKACTSKTLTSS